MAMHAVGNKGPSYTLQVQQRSATLVVRIACIEASRQGRSADYGDVLFSKG
jgi:hypothetical protein